MRAQALASLVHSAKGRGVNGGFDVQSYGSSVAARRPRNVSLTLRDVFGAAESVSAHHAPEIVRALLASGRVRFVNEDVQRKLDAVAQLLAADGAASGRGAA